jgi:hypothetical protein
VYTIYLDGTFFKVSKALSAVITSKPKKVDQSFLWFKWQEETPYWELRFEFMDENSKMMVFTSAGPNYPALMKTFKQLTDQIKRRDSTILDEAFEDALEKA